MRGQADEQTPLFHVFNVEDRIRPDHPLRDIKRRVDGILDGMFEQFAQAYSRTGRPSVPPERLLKALLLMTLYSVRSERASCANASTPICCSVGSSTCSRAKRRSTPRPSPTTGSGSTTTT